MASAVQRSIARAFVHRIKAMNRIFISTPEILIGHLTASWLTGANLS